jgi:hypothetical protein
MKETIMNTSSKRKKYPVYRIIRLTKNKLSFCVFIFFFALIGCKGTLEDAGFPSVTALPTSKLPVTPTDILVVTVTPHMTVASVLPSQEPVTPLKDAVSTIPPTAEITITPTPMLFMDQGYLLYGMDINQEEQVYALRPGGTSQYVVTGRLLSPLSPDQTKIVIDTNDWSLPPLSTDNVFILNLQTGEMIPTQLKAHPRNGLFWSEDDVSLLYVARYDNETPDQLIVYDIVTGKNQIIVEMEEILYTAGWSIDGQKIAYVAQVDGQYDLFTVNSKTLEQEKVTDNSEIETMVLWSPTAPKLLVGSVLDEKSAFESWPWGVENLYLFNDVSHDWRLLVSKWLGSESVSWSPDGKQILFADAGLLCIKNIETGVETCPLAEIAPYNEYYASYSEPPIWLADSNWLAFRAHNGTCYMVHFLEMETNIVIPGDLGCDVSLVSPLSPIYWSSSNLPRFFDSTH